MRNCPICDGSTREDLGDYDGAMSLYACDCGMHYLDAIPANQKELDAYYASDTSPDLQGKDSMDRLEALAKIALNAGRTVDIGGSFSVLKWMLNCETINAGQELTGVYDCVILSHTLEHVYDVAGLMNAIVEHSHTGSRLIVEIPYWEDYNQTGYDAHWQHMNKFTKEAITRLFNNYGYTAKLTVLPDFQEYHCLRVEGILDKDF